MSKEEIKHEINRVLTDRGTLDKILSEDKDLLKKLAK
jgi:hypothetical protein